MTTAKTPAEGASLRDAHKLRTARALRESALDLFYAQGYDATTTEEVAERAGVSVRTFFRYFPTKDAVMFFGQQSWARSFKATYCSLPAEYDDLDALCATLVKLATILKRRNVHRYERIILSSPSLRGRAYDFHKENSRHVAEAIAARRGLAATDAACEMLGSVAVLLYRRSLDEWLDIARTSSISEIIMEKFALLRDVLKPDGAARGIRRPVAKTA